MSLPTPPALGAALADALAGADPGATQQLQQLAAPASDAAAKAQALQAEAAQAAQAVAPAEAAAAQAGVDLGKAFSPITPVGQPAVPCACADCIGRAVDPALAAATSAPVF